jgi:hypothetical protein
MSKRTTPAGAAARKRAAFATQRAAMSQRRGKSHGLTKAQKRNERGYCEQFCTDAWGYPLLSRFAYLGI